VRRSLALLVVLGAGLLAGCAGIGDDDSVKVRVSGPVLVTKNQIASLPAGSPARTVFEWWRALQFSNPTIAANYYSAKLHITPLKLDKQLQAGPAIHNLGSRPHLVATQVDGDHAVVNVLLENQADNPNGRVDKTQVARGFNLVREDGEWKLAENMYLERGVRVQKEFIRAANKVRKSGGG
jgi:hypothetical protein